MIMGTDLNLESYQELADDRLTDMTRNDPVFQAIQKGLITVLQNKQEELISFSSGMWNLESSIGKQLDFIGNMVGQSRQLITDDLEPFFGFDGADAAETFSSVADPALGGRWRSLLSNKKSSTVRLLDDTTYRLLLKARVLVLGGNCSINHLLKVVNILTSSTTATVDFVEAGYATLSLPAENATPLFRHFFERRYRRNSLIPIPLGVRVEVNYV